MKNKFVLGLVLALPVILYALVRIIEVVYMAKEYHVTTDIIAGIVAILVIWYVQADIQDNTDTQ